VCPFVHSFGSVSKLDSESNPFIRCVALLNEQMYSTILVFHYSLMLLVLWFLMPLTHKPFAAV
jgi:hypothetical protein